MIEEKILTPILEYYLNAPFEEVIQNIVIKERIPTDRNMRNMQIIIYSNDHNPPHFHVKAKDNSIDAKFLIKDCTKISGELSSKDLKRIQAFHSDIKTQKVMEMVWNKRKR